MKNSSLSIIHTGKFPFANDPNSILVWCPKMNLIFISMNKTSIWCYRVDGERIYSINNRSVIKSIAFFDNLFCLSGVDSLVKIYDSNDGKLVKILNNEYDNIQFINWVETAYNLEDELISNLPRIHSISSSLNYLVINDKNSINLCFNKSLNIRYPLSSHITQQLSKELFQQIYLDDKNNLISVNINTSSKKLYVKSVLMVCQIIEYLEHMNNTIVKIEEELKPFLTLFDRYLSNLNDEVNGNLISVLNDMLLTNIIPESTKDFWCNQFGERGYKKIIKSLESIYDDCEKRIFTYSAAPIERIIILLNNLTGICKWKNVLGLNVTDLVSIMQRCQNSLKSFYRLIWTLKDEKSKIAEFISWWKTILDMLNDQEFTRNYSTSNLIEYINTNLLRSETLNYFRYDLDLIKPADFQSTLLEKHLETENIFSRILQQINTHHQSIVTVKYSRTLKLSNTNLKISQWDDKTVITYIDESNNLILSTPEQDFAKIPNVLAYEHRSKDLIALTKEHLLIVDTSSSIPFNLPELSFEPKKVKSNKSYVCLTDKMNSDYVILKVE
ncbi:uncharacterized protein KGF55_002167 [Candida pseudojiufengensis]|uniref:uncharacterized protein n=1 Tax=Candida pseudojiufengensis TaxID=497109 RepID=UPI002224C4ED|nr:uncharacterized protein KGF55_002167 [Candida pseudojiufengensis]KAI5964225.1 hypothetical protein KGF55_002167 [Candida pseudojiufengensis]